MKGSPYKSLYDITADANWAQIFGGNKWLWPFPIFRVSGKPLGDGIYWPKNRPDKNDEKDKERQSLTGQGNSDHNQSSTTAGSNANKANLYQQ